MIKSWFHVGGFIALVYSGLSSTVLAQFDEPRSDHATSPPSSPTQSQTALGATQIGSNAAWTTEIAIEAPAFRGLEPQLVVAYASHDRSGLLGAGWTLNGLMSVDRVSGNFGVPRYDSSDTFRLDGERLLPCASIAAGRSAACDHQVSGMVTYVTERESLVRVAYDRSTNVWHVWQPDGSKFELAESWQRDDGATPQERTYRWTVSRRLSLRGHEVRYVWRRDSFQRGSVEVVLHRYLERVEYNHHRIRFFYEPRPDHTPATEGGHFGMVRERLRTVDVQTELPGSGSWRRVRAYAFRYQQ